MDPEDLNEILQGKKIISVGLGRTPGWLLLNFDSKDFGHPEDVHVYLTVFVGGIRERSSEDRYYSTCALHEHALDGRTIGTVASIRDGRDEEMPMSIATSPSQAWLDSQQQANSDPDCRPRRGRG